MHVVVNRLVSSHLLQVDDAKADYKRTVGWWRWWVWPDPESYIFSKISRGEKPKSRQRIGEAIRQSF